MVGSAGQSLCPVISTGGWAAGGEAWGVSLERAELDAAAPMQQEIARMTSSFRTRLLPQLPQPRPLVTALWAEIEALGPISD